ncbi:MAG: sugar ABC transporter permease [Ruminococcaceae bacterium]|nr:sugar ABC transporter permease [Oscillospiraceae bacterium]
MKTEKKFDEKQRGQTGLRAISSGYAFKCIKKNKGKYMFLLPGLILTIVFGYIPLPGLYMAFVDYNPFRGIFGSTFVGLENIKSIFMIPEFLKAITNTLLLSGISLFLIFPLPIVFALLLNEVSCRPLKRLTQTFSYLPHFISTIAVVGIATTLFSSSGIVNDLRISLLGEGTERILFLGQQSFFVPNIVILTIWQSVGWNTIIYLSGISGIDPSLYEAAIIDGAGKMRQCWHITLPSLRTTIIMLFVLQIGQLFTSNFDLIFGLQNVFIDFEVISTIIYKQGITQGNYSVATAFSFVSGTLSVLLILGANYLSKKLNDTSLI